MCDQTQITYKPNDIVWVKLSGVWWPAQVQDEATLDKDVTYGLKKKPLAIVKFFNEDFYEFIKNLDQIYHYNCLKKDEFIQKGLDLCSNKSRRKPSSMGKFPADVRQAELITGGDPNICDDPKFREKNDEKFDKSLTESNSKLPKSAMKRQSDTLGEPVKKHIRFSLPGFSSDKKKISKSSTQELSSVDNLQNLQKGSSNRRPKSRSLGVESPLATKLARADKHVASPPLPRPVSQEVIEKIKKKNYQSLVRIQPTVRSESPSTKEKLYTCFRCFDTTNRLNLLIEHYKDHERYGMNIPPMSPKPPVRITSPIPGPSREDEEFKTPKTKNKKSKTNESKKINSETPVKKRIRKDDVFDSPQIPSNVRNIEATSTRKKSKKMSKSKNVEVDQNKVLRDKILKDWDDESDEDVGCNKQVLSTIAEIHSSHNQSTKASPISEQKEIDSSETSAPSENSDVETTVSSTNDLNISNAEISSKQGDSAGEFAREEVNQENQLPSDDSKVDDRETKSCFDFEDNDEAINLDKSHKFGQKLPRVLSEEKIKKPDEITSESETIKINEPGKDDSEIIENQVEELLKVTEMSDFPIVPNSGPKSSKIRKKGKRSKITAKSLKFKGIVDESSSLDETTKTERDIGVTDVTHLIDAAETESKDYSTSKFSEINEACEDKKDEDVQKEEKAMVEEVKIECHTESSETEINEYDTVEELELAKTETVLIHIDDVERKDLMFDEKELMKKEDVQAIDEKMEGEHIQVESAEVEEISEKDKCENHVVLIQLESNAVDNQVEENAGDQEEVLCTSIESVEQLIGTDKKDLNSQVGGKADDKCNIELVTSSNQTFETNKETKETNLQEDSNFVMDKDECEAIEKDATDKNILDEKCDSSGKNVNERAEEEIIKKLEIKSSDQKQEKIKVSGVIEVSKVNETNDTYESKNSSGNEAEDKEKFNLEKVLTTTGVVTANDKIISGIDNIRHTVESKFIKSEEVINKDLEVDTSSDSPEIDVNKKLLLEESKDAEVANEDLLVEVQKEVNSFVKLEFKEENKKDIENVNFNKNALDNSPPIGKTLAEVIKPADKNHTDEPSIDNGKSAHEGISEFDAKGKNNDLAAIEEVHNEIDITTEQDTSTDFIIEDIVKNVQEIETTELQVALPDNSGLSSQSSDLQKNSPKESPAIKVDKYYPVPELGSYSSELLNVSTDIHQWTAMEYYADLEAQVRNDLETEENGKQLETSKTSMNSSRRPKQINDKSVEQEKIENQSTTHKENSGEEILKKTDEENKKETNLEKNKENTKQIEEDRSKQSDCNRSGIIYDFKLDYTEHSVVETPPKTAKSKKRKWEEKDPNDKGNELSSDINKDEKQGEMPLLEQTEDSFNNESTDIPEVSSHSEETEVANKKLKLELPNENTEGLSKSETTMDEVYSSTVIEEITISQEQEALAPGEIVVSTSESVDETIKESKEANESSQASSVDAKGNSGELQTTNLTAPILKEELSLETNTKINFQAQTAGSELQKKEATTSSFDPSQMELDINSMPVVIEEDLIQDIKLPTTSPSISFNSTNKNMKQIRIQLRKAGDNNTSLLQGTQNGKIIRIPGTTKEPALTKKIQGTAGSNKVPTVSNLLPQRTIASTNQTMFLKMNPIQNSGGQAKYTVSKNQIRTTGTTLASTSAAGQPVKVHIIQPTQQNAKLIVQSQQKPFTGKLTSTRVITKAPPTNTSCIAGAKTLTSTNKTGQKLIFNQKRTIIPNKNILTKTATLGVNKITAQNTTATQKNPKSVVVTKPGAVSAQSSKNVVLPASAVQATSSGVGALQVVSQNLTPKVIMQRKTKSLTGSSSTSVKSIPTQAGTIYIHTSQGLVPASKNVAKHFLNQLPQISTASAPQRPSLSSVTNLKRTPAATKSRPTNVNVNRPQKKGLRQQAQTTVQTSQVQSQSKQQLLSIPASSISSHELILNNVPVQFQNIGASQSSDVKMLYLVDERGQYHQVDNSPLIAIDNSGENRSVFIESNSNTDVDNLFLTFGESSNVVNVTTAATTPSQDILAKALANTQVLQSDTSDIPDTIEGTTLYVEPQYPAPTLTHNVLETSFSLNPPIMTPLEVPSSVSPQITSIASNLIPVSTVDTVGKKTETAQPSMPLLTDDVEVATSQTVFLDSSSLVSGTSQSLTFQVINSEGNIVVATTPSSSSTYTISTPVCSNKTSNQVMFTTELLKSDSRNLNVAVSSKIERSSLPTADTCLPTEINSEGCENEESIPNTLGNLETDSNPPTGVEGSRQIIQSSKLTRIRDNKRARTDSVNSDKQQNIKNITDTENIERINKEQPTSNTTISSRIVVDELFQKRLQHDPIIEKKEDEEKAGTSIDTQFARITQNNKTTVGSFTTYTQPILTEDNDPKFVLEEKR